MVDIVNNYTNEQLEDAAYKKTGVNPSEIPLNSDLGTAAYSDVQTSPTDTTTGAVMTVGAFGNGSIANESTINCNTFLESGRRGHSASVSNGPSGQTFGIVICDYYTTGSSGRGSQHFIGTSGIGIWQRTMTSGTWSDWQPVYTGENYQPENSNGIGVVKRMRNISGGAVSNGATVSGTLLQFFSSDASGSTVSSGLASGVWRNVTGLSVANNNRGDFVRES